MGWLAVPHLTLALIAIQTLTFLAAASNPDIAAAMVLDTRLVLAGQWWRLLTFMMLPPTFSPLWLLFAFYIFYLMGTALEQAWGEFRYTLYWLIGYLASVGLAFAVPGEVVTNGYLTASILLAFAMLFPNFELLLFFILPVKVKWFALLTWLVYGYQLVSGLAVGNFAPAVMVTAATLNFFVFFGVEVVQRVRSGHRRMQRQRDSIADTSEPFHRCVVCGRTDRTDLHLEFRYAREGSEVRCYCVEHLPAQV